MTRPTIGVLSPYWTSPPTGGGPVRIHNLNRELSVTFEVHQFSARPTLGHKQLGNWTKSRKVTVTSCYSEFQHFDPLVLGSSYLLYRCGHHSDVLLSAVLRRTALRRVRRSLDQAAVLQIEHPWLIDLAGQIAHDRPIVYVAHNIESKLWGPYKNAKGGAATRLADLPKSQESRAMQLAARIVAMSGDDADTMITEFGVRADKITVVPNGARVDRVFAPTVAEKRAARARLGFDRGPVLLFTGSDHYPNKEALAYILRWSEQVVAQIVIVGGVGQGRSSYRNVHFTGFVRDVTDYLLAADVALNPLVSGSGTSLKAVEYLAYGLPMVTTKVGIRGLEALGDNDLFIADITDFPAAINHLMANPELQKKLAVNGFAAARKHYSWYAISTKMHKVYGDLI